MLLQLFFTVAFSAAPLTLYIPPIRCFSLFVQTAETFLRQSTPISLTFLHRLRFVFSRLLSSLFRT